MTLFIFAVFVLSGIGLCIGEHKGWGIMCLVIALMCLLAMI